MDDRKSCARNCDCTAHVKAMKKTEYTANVPHPSRSRSGRGGALFASVGVSPSGRHLCSALQFNSQQPSWNNSTKAVNSDLI